MRDERVLRYFRLAQIESLKSNHHSHKMGAVFVRKNHIISSGCNFLTKTHPFVRRLDPHKTMHAEVDAIFKLKNKDQLKGSSVFIYRENVFGPAIARPCPICMQILKIFGIRKAYYTVNGQWAMEKIL